MTQPPVDVVTLAVVMDVDVILVDSEWDGALHSLLMPPEAKIYLNRKTEPNSQRFIVAHEIGHLMLHETGLVFRDVLSSTGLRPREVEANAFAADLLMPRWMIQAYAPLGSLEDLARTFNVSSRAMSIRLENLGYLSKAAAG
jgi:Zn-dependent peptidase ImmA (M78 family)